MKAILKRILSIIVLALMLGCGGDSGPISITFDQVGPYKRPGDEWWERAYCSHLQGEEPSQTCGICHYIYY